MERELSKTKSEVPRMPPQSFGELEARLAEGRDASPEVGDVNPETLTYDRFKSLLNSEQGTTELFDPIRNLMRELVDIYGKKAGGKGYTATELKEFEKNNQMKGFSSLQAPRDSLRRFLKQAGESR